MQLRASSLACESLSVAWSDTAWQTSLAWRPCVFLKLAVPVHRCLNSYAPPHLSDYCIPIASADTWQHVCSANHKLLTVPHYRLNTYSHQVFFQLPAPSLELSPRFHPAHKHQCRLVMERLSEFRFNFDSINWNRINFTWNNRKFRLLSSTKEAVKYFMQKCK